ncbi:hypothetical protein E4U17_003006 [Claviceps sp. LM77 group G4]|nr:hypothetical protein E4U17_003006 [Claviceps sp. LM77 group G4]KAG6075755.1 hypothetical protein E4U16_003183 [Claviceps sp. LM84 group G4]KAG6081483.1 hypothetical protein E4U33_006807 [Claviceps sp. LM78 group G4]
MSYNQYGGNPYGMPPGYGGGYGAPPPGMNAPPGLGAPPGMAAPPGMSAPPGMQQANAPQSGRPGGLPANFQAPANMPNINFNAPVIRLGTTAPSAEGGRGDRTQAPGHGGMGGGGGGRSGHGMERGSEQSRGAARDAVQSLIPPTSDERLRTIMLYQIPDGVRGDDGVQKLLGSIGTLRKWESSASAMDDHKGSRFGFALFDDADSVFNAVKLLYEQDVEVPVYRQNGSSDPPPENDEYEGIEKTKLHCAVDPASLKYVESVEEKKANDPDAPGRLESAKAELKRFVRELFYPPISNGADVDGDTAMKNGTNENVEVVNIAIAQEDELADIPAEMREVVAGEIAAFRERSNQRDLERLRKEEEIEEMERRKNGASRQTAGSNNIPLGPRASLPNAPSGPRGHNGASRGASFLNAHGEFGINRAEEETDASDEELRRRHVQDQNAEDEKAYMDAERKWANRERSRQSALDREQDRERQEAESEQRKKDDQLERERSWNDEREASRKSHLYYRDHGTWARKRGMDRVDEETQDELDRRAESEELRREEVQMERARGMANSFLDQQAEEMDRREAATASAAAAAPQPFKLSLGAAAQKAQASKGPQRRTIAEVEGLLDDEDTEQSSKRQLIPIQMEPISGAAAMTEEEISQAVRALAQEIPSEKEGLWNWEVKWDYMDDSIVREKLRPFVEKKVVDYLGVQEEMLVEAVEEHLRKHGTAPALVDELEGALDEDAEDLVKKLWRMVIFFTESEKRGLPA